MRPYYEHGGITIYHGDCRDVLPQLKPKSVSLLLTDPPYGKQYGGKNNTATIIGDGVRQGMRVLRAALFASLPALTDKAHAYVYCHWQSWPDFYDSVSAYLTVKNALIWWKARGGMGNTKTYANDFEVVLFASKGARGIFGRRDGAVMQGHPPPAPARRTHPTEKPESLMGYLIGKSSAPGELVVDPFMGSGATLVAAKKSGRRAVGVELKEEYCEAAAKRLRAAN